MQVEETPFSLCVVIPIGSTFLELPELSTTFPSLEQDVYHRIDVPNISQSLNLCQYMGHNAVKSKYQELHITTFPPLHSKVSTHFIVNQESTRLFYLMCSGVNFLKLSLHKPHCTGTTITIPFAVGGKVGVVMNCKQTKRYSSRRQTKTEANSCGSDVKHMSLTIL